MEDDEDATTAFVDGAGVGGDCGAGVGAATGGEVGLPGVLEGAGEGLNDIDGFIEGAGAAVTTRSSIAASPAAPAPVTARILIRVAEETSTTPEERIAFKASLERALTESIGPLEVERLEFVGPKVGAELRRDGLLALSLACVLILVYIGFRFSLRFAPGALRPMAASSYLRTSFP